MNFDIHLTLGLWQSICVVIYLCAGALTCCIVSFMAMCQASIGSAFGYSSHTLTWLDRVLCFLFWPLIALAILLGTLA